MTNTPLRDADVSVLALPRDDSHTTSPRRSTSWMWAAWCIVGGLCIGAVWWSMDWLRNTAPEVDAAPIRIAGPQNPSSGLSSTGYVIAQRQASVASKGTGRLEYLGVGVGSRVKAGDIIARVQQDDVQALQQQAKARLEVARAALANAQAELRDAQLSYARAKALLPNQFVSQAEYDTTANRLRRAEASVRSSSAAITAAEADVQTADVMLENTIIRAPFDGTVLKKFAEIGEVVAPMAGSASSRGAVVLIADMSSLAVETEISETSIAQVAIGQLAEIQLDAVRNKRYAGTTDQIVPTADRSKGTVLAKIRFNELDAQVLPEMSAKVFFAPPARLAPSKESQFLIPSTALAQRNGRTVLFTIETDSVREIPVDELSKNGGDSEVRGELHPSMQVVLAPPSTLQHGTRIRLRPQP